MANRAQCRIARRLDIDVSGDSDEIAAARILDAVAPALLARPERPSTTRQRKFAESLALDVGADSLRVASVRIAETLRLRNLDAAARMRMRPGRMVVLETDWEWQGQRICSREAQVVSSVGKDGLVYFRGGGGRCAWASTLRLPTAEEARTVRSGGRLS